MPPLPDPRHSRRPGALRAAVMAAPSGRARRPGVSAIGQTPAGGRLRRIAAWGLALCCLAGATAPALPAEPNLAADPAWRDGNSTSATLGWRGWRGVLFRVVPPAIPGQTAPVSHLLGTLHFGSLQELGLDPVVLRQLLGQARLFIDEASPPDTGHWPAALERHRSLPASQSLAGLLGRAPFAALHYLLPDIPAAGLQRMKPWMALALLESRGETAGDHTLDRQVARWAAEAGLPALHLETLAEQLRALDCVPAQEHAQVLRQRLATPWLFEEQAQRVLEFYRAGDLPAWLDEIDAMVGLDAAASAVEHRARLCLIEARNARWLKQLDPLLRAGNAFVAVGAIHLTGDKGLLASLQQQGYDIDAYPLPPPSIDLPSTPRP